MASALSLVGCGSSDATPGAQAGSPSVAGSNAAGSGGSAQAAAGAPGLAGGGASAMGGSPPVAGASGNAAGSAGTGALAGASGSGTAGSAQGGQAGSAAGTGGAAAAGASGGTGGAVPAFDRAAVTAIMRRVADYEIARFGTGNDNGWVRAVFHTGMLAAARALAEPKYHDYTRSWGQANNWQLHADGNGLRFADNQACAQSYAELYSEAPSAQNAVYIAAAQTTFDAMVAAPKTGRVEWWWCDALFMAPGALLRVGLAANKPQYITLVNNMFWDTHAFLYDPAQSLFWRDATYKGQNVYWARGNGWVVAGLARILEVLPPTNARRPDYEALLKQMSTKLATLQQSDGFWRSSLTVPTLFPSKESSGTAFFCYGMAWGIHHGILDRATYLPIVSKAWAALGTAVTAQGRLGWVQAVGQAPGPSTVDSTNDYATGAFLLAGSELLAL